jgi:mannose-6-phosphate isomerase-like protein (cupin superfamily)
MLIKREDIKAINFEGLLIHDFTAGQSTSASFAVIEVPAGVRHREAWSKRSDKYYYVVSGQLCFTLEGIEHLLSRGSLCLVAQGQKFSYHNRSAAAAQLILVHVPSFDLESERFTSVR